MFSSCPGGHDAVGLAQERREQVDARQLLVPAVGRQVLCGLDRLAGLDGELLEADGHGLYLLRSGRPGRDVGLNETGVPGSSVSEVAKA